MSRKKSQHPKVFISYSWDSEEHKGNVFDLADCLRSHGINCNIDQYEVSPVEGWQNWMRNQVEQADFVLLVCTEQYKRRFQGREQRGRGKGVTWEGAIISQLIYDQQANTQFIPVIFEPQAGSFIPSEIKRYTHYLLNPDNFALKEPGYEALYRCLTQQSRQRQPLGKIIPLPPLKRHRVDPPDNNDQIQQERLTRFYRDAQRYYRTRYWSKAIDVFRRMQKENLPYYDPDGIYRSARRELVKEEQERRRLVNIYTQGEKHYQDHNWFAAQRKFEEILRCQPRDRELEKLVERQLIKTQMKLANEKQLSTVLIVLSWFISALLPQVTMGVGVIGGFFSGIVIWFVSQWTRPLKPSQKVLRLLFFIFIGVVAELIIRQLCDQLPNLMIGISIKSIVASAIGIAISIAAMLWQISNRMQGK